MLNRSPVRVLLPRPLAAVTAAYCPFFPPCAALTLEPGSRSPARFSAPRRRTQHREQLGEREAHLMARNDRVEHPVRQQKLGCLKIAGKLLVSRLLDNPPPGKPDNRTRFSDIQVAQARERRRHAARRRIAHYRNVRQSRLADSRDRRRYLRHLHQRQRALLHAGAARRREDHDWQPPFECAVEQSRKLFAHGHAHAAAHEAEIHHGERRGPPLDFTDTGYDSVVASALPARLLHPLRIWARIYEL